MFHNLKTFFQRLIPNLDEETWRSFLDLQQIKHYKKGTIISHEGRTNNIVSFIEKGAVMQCPQKVRHFFGGIFYDKEKATQF